MKLQSFDHLMRTDSLEKTLMLGNIEGKRRRGQQDEVVRQHHRLSAHEFEQTPGDSAQQSSLACCSPWGCRVRLNLVREQQKMKSSPENSPVSCRTHSRWTDQHREADGSASREVWGIRKVPLDLMR